MHASVCTAPARHAGKCKGCTHLEDLVKIIVPVCVCLSEHCSFAIKFTPMRGVLDSTLYPGNAFVLAPCTAQPHSVHTPLNSQPNKRSTRIHYTQRSLLWYPTQYASRRRRHPGMVQLRCKYWILRECNHVPCAKCVWQMQGEGKLHIILTASFQRHVLVADAAGNKSQ